MDYTDEQYDLMEKLSKRVMWDNLSSDEQELISYLDGEKIARPRADIEDGLWTLSPDGERVLAAHRQKVRAAKIQTQRELEALREQESIRQENIRREKEKEQKRAEEISCEKADRDAEKRADRKFQIALAFLNFFLAFLAGIVIEYFAGIMDFIIGLFD